MSVNRHYILMKVFSHCMLRLFLTGFSTTFYKTDGIGSTLSLYILTTGVQESFRITLSFMKFRIFLLVILSIITIGCQEDYDERLEDLEDRVSKLEEICKETNANLAALQTIVTALQEQISITQVEQLSDGYTIHFSDGTSATIKDGKDTGSVPVFGVRKDVDGIYYWTLDGEWLKDEQGNKVRAQGDKGEQGETGTTGITPQLKIEDAYWFVSYDNGETWSQLGEATGDNGTDCLFKSVLQDDENVYFILSDDTIITIPKGNKDAEGEGELPGLDDTDDVCEEMDDINFMAYCYENFDVNKDSRVSMAEANAVKIIECNTAQSFKGIEYFTNLESFKSSSVETVDFRYNKKLTTLSCGGAPVTLLDLRYNTMLSTINIENCTNLVELIFAGDAPLSLVSSSNTGGCKALETVSLPDNCNIGEQAFYKCNNLKKIKFPANLTSIGESAFYGCDGLTTVTFPESLTSIGESAFYGCDGLTTVTFPESLTSIGESAFSHCEGLTLVTFPASLTSIGESAFSYCEGLTSVSFPAGMRSIGESAFSYCEGLTSVTFNSTISCGRYAFRGSQCIFYGYGVTSDNMMYAPSNTLECVSPLINNDIVIPSGVTSIGSYALSNCEGLTSVTFPESLTNIGSYAFYDCDGLTSVTFPEGLRYIDWHAFSYCDELTSVTFPESLIRIMNYAFSYCEGLTSVTLPESLTDISQSAFYRCSLLTSIDASQCKNIEYIGPEAFYRSPIKEFLLGTSNPPLISLDYYGPFSHVSDATLKVPAESVEAYKASDWADYFDNIVPLD